MGGQWEGRVRLAAGTACGATGRLDLFREVQRRTKGGGLRLSQLLWGGPTGFSLQWRQGWLWGQQQSGWWVREAWSWVGMMAESPRGLSGLSGGAVRDTGGDSEAEGGLPVQPGRQSPSPGLG